MLIRETFFLKWLRRNESIRGTLDKLQLGKGKTREAFRLRPGRCSWLPLWRALLSIPSVTEGWIGWCSGRLWRDYLWGIFSPVNCWSLLRKRFDYILTIVGLFNIWMKPLPCYGGVGGVHYYLERPYLESCIALWLLPHAEDKVMVNGGWIIWCTHDKEFYSCYVPVTWGKWGGKGNLFVFPPQSEWWYLKGREGFILLFPWALPSVSSLECPQLSP